MKTKVKVPEVFKEAYIARHFDESNPLQLDFVAIEKSFAWEEGGKDKVKQLTLVMAVLVSTALQFINVEGGWSWKMRIFELIFLPYGFLIFYERIVVHYLAPTSNIGAKCMDDYVELFHEIGSILCNRPYKDVAFWCDDRLQNYSDKVVVNEGTNDPTEKCRRALAKQNVYRFWNATDPFGLVSKTAEQYLKEANQRKKALATKQKTLVVSDNNLPPLGS